MLDADQSLVLELREGGVHRPKPAQPQPAGEAYILDDLVKPCRAARRRARGRPAGRHRVRGDRDWPQGPDQVDQKTAGPAGADRPDRLPKDRRGRRAGRGVGRWILGVDVHGDLDVRTLRSGAEGRATVWTAATAATSGPRRPPEPKPPPKRPGHAPVLGLSQVGFMADMGCLLFVVSLLCRMPDDRTIYRYLSRCNTSLRSSQRRPRSCRPVRLSQ